MTVHPQATSLPMAGDAPAIPESALVLSGVFLSGRVRLGERVSIWPNASLRAEFEPIVIGDDSNIQDSVSCHVDIGRPLSIGERVSVGHNAVLHGCTVEDQVLIGMHATVMNGAVIGSGSIVAAGALIPEGVVVPPRSLVAGVPAKVRRETTDEEVEAIGLNAAVYLDLLERYAAALATGE